MLLAQASRSPPGREINLGTRTPALRLSNGEDRRALRRAPSPTAALTSAPPSAPMSSTPSVFLGERRGCWASGAGGVLGPAAGVLRQLRSGVGWNGSAASASIMPAAFRSGGLAGLEWLSGGGLAPAAQLRSGLGWNGSAAWVLGQLRGSCASGVGVGPAASAEMKPAASMPSFRVCARAAGFAPEPRGLRSSSQDPRAGLVHWVCRPWRGDPTNDLEDFFGKSNGCRPWRGDPRSWSGPSSPRSAAAAGRSSVWRWRQPRRGVQRQPRRGVFQRQSWSSGRGVERAAEPCAALGRPGQRSARPGPACLPPG